MNEGLPKDPENPDQLPAQRWLRQHLKLSAGAVGVVIVLALVALMFIPHARRSTGYQPPPPKSPTPSASARPYAVSAGPPPAAPLKAPDGYTIHVFADHLGRARDLQFTPGGTLLVSDLAANRVIALPDVNHDGVADAAKVVLLGGANTHGLAFHGGQLFVAQLDGVYRYNWDETALTATLDRKLFALPSPNPDHNSRTLAIAPDGTLYVSVGSTCNVCRESDPHNATVMVSDTNGTNPRVFATGLRNASFLTLDPTSGELWGTEMGRDYLGDNLPPDEINIIRQGQDYGWPYCYGDRVHDSNFDPSGTHTCEATVPPVFDIPAHNAPLGLAFVKSAQFPVDQQGDLLVALHGSWNSTVPVGYKVVRLTVRGNSVTGMDDFLTGFSNDTARPVDVTFDATGNLYVSDDKSGTVYIVQKNLK
jgi:glucose/arabinose dehydrogenase